MQEAAAAQSFESLFLDHLQAIEKIIAFISSRHGLRGADAEDFSSLVKLKLIENDYAVLRKFRGESTLPTYLAVVIASLYRDYRFHRWGRWRPSAMARAYGEDAVKLETLLYRDGYSITEAIHIIARQSSLDERTLRGLIAKLPVRDRMRPIEVDADTMTAEIDTASADTADTQNVEARSRIEKSLNEAVDSLQPEDRTIIKMKFWSGMSVADISRIAGIPQKHLYRRIEKLSVSLRSHLRQAGVSSEDVRELIDG
jgi:RNA polymerase sigma factor (sigma-70 family)